MLRPPVNSTPRLRPSAAIPMIARTSAAVERPSQVRPLFIRSGFRSVSRVRMRPTEPSPVSAGRRRRNGMVTPTLGQHPRDDQRRDHRGDDTDAERVTPNPLTGPDAEQEQQSCGQQGGHIGVDDRAPGFGEPDEAECPSHAHRRVRGVLLAGAFENEHVGVDRHPDRQHEPGQVRAGSASIRVRRGGRRRVGRSSPARASP